MMRHARGVSLLEMAVMMTILAVVALAFSQTMITSSRSTRQSDEYMAAARAARWKMEEIAARKFTEIPTLYASGSVTGPGNTFRVALTEESNQIDLPGLGTSVVAPAVVPHAGEVITILNENTTTATPLLRDLSPADGVLDLVRNVQLPMDFDGNGTTTSGNVPVGLAVRMLVGVIIRWQGPVSEERYELWTVVSRY